MHMMTGFQPSCRLWKHQQKVLKGTVLSPLYPKAASASVASLGARRKAQVLYIDHMVNYRAVFSTHECFFCIGVFALQCFSLCLLISLCRPYSIVLCYMWSTPMHFHLPMNLAGVHNDEEFKDLFGSNKYDFHYDCGVTKPCTRIQYSDKEKVAEAINLCLQVWQSFDVDLPFRSLPH